MPVDPTLKRPLTQLNFEIEAAETDVKRLEVERTTIARFARKAARRLQYLRLAHTMRGPGANYSLWNQGLMFVGSTVVGIIVLVAVHFLTGSYPAAFLGFLFGTVAGVGLFASLLFNPPDTLLLTAITEAETHVRLEEARLREKVERINETKTRLNTLLEERRDQIASGKLQKAALLQRNWKAMREAEWDDFVVEAFRTLGAKVDRLPKSDGDDANMIADFGSRRVAVLTEAKDHNASSATIQLALAAKNRHHCDSSAVIINRRFTGAAQDFGLRNGCTAIGVTEFPDFVMGKIEL